MRKLSLWAKHHTYAARILIVLFYLPLNVAGIITGDLLFDFGLRFSTTFLEVVMVVFVITVFTYPSKGHRKPGPVYLRRKMADLLLVVCTFLMVSYTGNHLNDISPVQSGSSARAALTSQNTNASTTVHLPLLTKADPQPEKTSKKQLRKKFRFYLKEFRRYYKSPSDGEKALLIALSVIGALFLVSVLASVSCSIACSGSEGLAYVVFFAGTAGIVVLLVKLIKRIKRGPKQQDELKTGHPEKKPPVRVVEGAQVE